MATVFLDQNEQFPVAGPAVVNGSSGSNDAVLVQDGVTGVNVDQTVEQVDLAQDLTAFEFNFTNQGNLEILDSGGNSVVSIASVPSEADGGLDVRTTSGNVNVTNPVLGEFRLTNPNDSSDTQPISQGGQPVQPNVGTGNQMSAANSGPTGGGGGNEITLSANRTGPFDAGNDDIVFDLEAGDYTAEIQNFGAGDQLDVPSNASVTFPTDTDTGDGMKDIDVNSESGTATIRLTGLSSTQEENVFNTQTFTSEFGSDALM